MVGAIGQQLRRVALLVVLREDEHRGLGLALTHLERCHQAVVAVAGRHVDVGHQQVWPVGETLAKDVRRVARFEQPPRSRPP